MSTPKTSRPDPSASSNWHIKLREILENYFDENDIETLCFDLRCDYESLEGQGKTRKIVELIKEFSHQGRLGELIDYCAKQRPNIAWAALREAALKNPLVVERQPDLARGETKVISPTPTPPARKSSRWLFAAIALVAVALILRALWPHESPPAPPAGCGGTDFAGACWYFGPENAPCDAVCAAHGGYNPATRAFAGSDGSAGSCQKLLDALGIPLDDFYPTTQGGLGCFALQTTSGRYYGYWDKDPTEPGATYPTPGRRRLCACNN
jgi:hypothetical protein